MQELKVRALGKQQHQCKCTGIISFLQQQDLPVRIDLILTQKKNKIICSYLWKIVYNGFKMPLSIKNINNFTRWKQMNLSIWWSRVLSCTKSTSRSLGAVRGVQWTLSIHSVYLLKSQLEIKKLNQGCQLLRIAWRVEPKCEKKIMKF